MKIAVRWYQNQSVFVKSSLIIGSLWWPICPVETRLADEHGKPVEAPRCPDPCMIGLMRYPTEQMRRKWTDKTNFTIEAKR